MKKPALISFLMIGVGICAFALKSHGDFDSSSGPMSLSRLLETFKQNPDVTTLDQLPARLPDDFLINFVLKHGMNRKGANGHLTETKVSQSADPLAPRAIIFDQRSGFTVSYNGGSPDQKANQRLDIMSFDQATKSFSLQQIDFPIQGGHAVPTTSDCVTCHGPKMRPIFAMYPDWPAFYGSENDELTRGNKVQSKELNDYVSFLERVVPKNPRYTPLFKNERVEKYLSRKLYPSFPYRPDTSEVANDVSRAFAFRPALRLGIVYNRLLNQSLVNQIKNHPRYEEFAPFFLFNLLQCSWPSEDSAAADRWLTKASRVIGSEPKTLEGKLLDYRQNLALFDLILPDVDLRYSYNHEGYKNEDASERVMEVGYIGRYFNSYFDGSATIDELLAASLYTELSARHKELSGITKPWGLVAKYQHRTERFKLDEAFFREMDALGTWIEMPYPAQISEVHHRETFKPEFAADYNNLCGALEKLLKNN